MIGGNHGLGGLLQLAEPVGLAGDAAGDFPQIAGDVRKLNPEAADPVRQLIDQTFAVRRHGGGMVRVAACATGITKFLSLNKSDKGA